MRYSNKQVKISIFDDKKGKNIGIEYRLQSIFATLMPGIYVDFAITVN